MSFYFQNRTVYGGIIIVRQFLLSMGLLLNYCYKTWNKPLNILYIGSLRSAAGFTYNPDPYIYVSLSEFWNELQTVFSIRVEIFYFAQVLMSVISLALNS